LVYAPISSKSIADSKFNCDNRFTSFVCFMILVLGIKLEKEVYQTVDPDLLYFCEMCPNAVNYTTAQECQLSQQAAAEWKAPIPGVSFSLPPETPKEERWVISNALALATSLFFSEPLIVLAKTVFWVAIHPIILALMMLFTCDFDCCAGDNYDSDDDFLEDGGVKPHARQSVKSRKSSRGTRKFSLVNLQRGRSSTTINQDTLYEFFHGSLEGYLDPGSIMIGGGVDGKSTLQMMKSALSVSNIEMQNIKNTKDVKRLSQLNFESAIDLEEIGA
jgi:hypothetical protein